MTPLQPSHHPPTFFSWPHVLPLPERRPWETMSQTSKIHNKRPPLLFPLPQPSVPTAAGRSDRHQLSLINPAWLCPSTSVSFLGLDHCVPRRTWSIFFLGSRLFSNWENKAQPWNRLWLRAGEGGESAGQEPVAASDRNEGQPVKPKDSLRGTVWGHQWHRHSQLHNMQEAPPKPASAEGGRGEQGSVPASSHGSKRWRARAGDVSLSVSVKHRNTVFLP